MHRYVTISSTALLILLVGCKSYEAQQSALLREGQRLQADREAVLASARQSVPFAHEFEQLFSGGSSSTAE